MPLLVETRDPEHAMMVPQRLDDLGRFKLVRSRIVAKRLMYYVPIAKEGKIREVDAEPP